EPPRAPSVAAMSIQSGMAGAPPPPTSPAPNTAKAPAPGAPMVRVGGEKKGKGPKCSGARPRARWGGEGGARAHEASTMVRSPTSTARRTVATDQVGEAIHV